jgi:hypothetical protein
LKFWRLYLGRSIDLRIIFCNSIARIRTATSIVLGDVIKIIDIVCSAMIVVVITHVRTKTILPIKHETKIKEASSQVGILTKKQRKPV